MRLVQSGVVLLLICALPFLAAANSPTGEEYKRWSDEYRLMYVVGFLDGEMTGKFATVFGLYSTITEGTRNRISDDIHAAKARGEQQDPACGCIADPKLVSSIEEVRNILDSYVAAHPEKRTKLVRTLAEEAFIDACKKRDNRP